MLRKAMLSLLLIYALAACAPMNIKAQQQGIPSAVPTAEEDAYMQEKVAALEAIQREMDNTQFSAVELMNALPKDQLLYGEPKVLFVELVATSTIEEAKIATVTGIVDSSGVNWQRVATLGGFGDPLLLQAAYEKAALPRGTTGYPADGGKIYPWQYAVSIAYGETNTQPWNYETTDIRTPGPWGYNQSYNTSGSKCQEGLDKIAAYMGQKYPNKYAGMTGSQIYTSSACAVGRTQVLASHFAVGGIYQNVQEMDLWFDQYAISEVTLIHLVGKGSSSCSGKNYYQGEDVQMSLCTYNPGAWGVPKYQWYFDGINRQAKNLEAAFAQVYGEVQHPVIGDANSKLAVPITGNVSLSGYHWGTYPNTVWAQSVGLAGTVHQGIDLGGTTPIAACDGIIIAADLRETVRARVNIQCDNGLELRYYHMDESTFPSTNIVVGNRVSVGTPLGELAPTGNCGTLCGGRHLHYEIWKDGKTIDPELYTGFSWSQ